jgi:predicted nucleic acid-binding protein
VPHAFVDSSAWIAHLSARDRRHAEAEETLRDALARRTALLTTNLVLAEVHRWLLFHAGPRPAAAAIDHIAESGSVTIVFATAVHHRAARAWLERLADQRISYTDAVSFAVMQTTRCASAITFDRDFASAGFRPWRPGAG